MSARSLLLQMAASKKMESFVRRNRWSSGVAARFVAGETIEAVVAPVRALNQQGITVSLDLLGESVSNQQEVAVVVDTYLRVFQQIRDQALNANVSVKLTALGLDMDDDFCQRNLIRLLNAAGPEQFVRIDMEGSEHTQRTLDLFYRLWNGPERYRNVGVVIQSYLRRSEADVERLIMEGVRVRLCKGAYKEPDSVAFPDKADVDANYVKLMQRLMTDGNYPGLATHDEKIIETAKQFARSQNIAADRFEFQMLYGIRRDLQTSLIKEGWSVRVYTPFGDYWYPYMMRRLAERPANLWFVAKNIFR